MATINDLATLLAEYATMEDQIEDIFDDIEDAIEDMGVTIPANTNPDDYAALIRSIDTGAGETPPTLYSPSISRSNDTITISNPSTNGSFVQSFKVYNGANLIKQQSGTTFSLVGLGPGNYELSVAAQATGFYDSDKSSKIKAAVYTIIRRLENLTSSNNTALLSNGLPYTVKITPENGYYLPENIVVTMNGAAYNKYTYDSYTGEITIPSVQGNIVIEATAYNALKLRRPVLELSNGVLSVTPARFAEATYTYVNGNLQYTYNDDRAFTVVKPDGATYGFTLNEDGYYQSENAGVNSSYAYAKITIQATYACHIALRCINYGYSSYNYGLISKIDTDLALSTSADGSNLYSKTFSNAHSNNEVLVEFDVPEGEHYITVKYRKTNSSAGSGFDGLKFKVDLM